VLCQTDEAIMSPKHFTTYSADVQPKTHQICSSLSQYWHFPGVDLLWFTC